MQHDIKSHQKASLGHLFSRVGRMLTGHAISKVHNAGFPEVRESWLPILQHVEEEGIRSIDLANRLAISKQAANQMVKEIQKQGYLQRNPDPKDKRAQLITLTDQGWQAWVIGLKAMAEMERRLETQLGLDNVDHMRNQAVIIEGILRM